MCPWPKGQVVGGKLSVINRGRKTGNQCHAMMKYLVNLFLEVTWKTDNITNETAILRKRMVNRILLVYNAS